MNKKYFPPILVPGNENTKVDIEIDQNNGLVIPHTTSNKKNLEKTLAKIMPSLADVRDAIKKAKEDNKHILVLPGSFDLVHKGHARYVRVSVNAYLKVANCKREDLFVVMLADDDELIKQVKAFKHIDFGGEEPQRRPVEKAPERALSMAHIPDVDIVGIVPAPNVRKDLLPPPPDFNINEILNDLEKNFENFEKSRILESGDNTSSEEMMTKIEKDKKELEKGILAYKELKENWNKKEIENVPVQAWQLYILSVINGVESGDSNHPERFKPKVITRLVNTADTKYLGQVLFLMKHANVGVALLDDAPIASTTNLIKWAMEEHKKRIAAVPGPWDIIREYKNSVIGEERLKNYNVAISKIENKLNKNHLTS